MAFEEENKYNHLEELGDSDFQIVEGEPDITGWVIIDAQSRTVGSVDDVLFDPQTRAVRYIIADLEDNELEIETDKKVLIPIGIAELRDQYDEDTEEDDTLEEVEDQVADDEDAFDDDVVYLPTITAEHLLALPAYEKGNVSPESEVAIRNIFERPTAETDVAYEKDMFYTHDHFYNKIYPRTEEPGSTESEQEYKPEDRRDNDQNRAL